MCSKSNALMCVFAKIFAVDTIQNDVIVGNKFQKLPSGIVNAHFPIFKPNLMGLYYEVINLVNEK